MAKPTVVPQKNKAKKASWRGPDGLFWLLGCYEIFPSKNVTEHGFASLKVKDHCSSYYD